MILYEYFIKHYELGGLFHLIPIFCLKKSICHLKLFCSTESVNNVIDENVKEVDLESTIINS